MRCKTYCPLYRTKKTQRRLMKQGFSLPNIGLNSKSLLLSGSTTPITDKPQHLGTSILYEYPFRTSQYPTMNPKPLGFQPSLKHMIQSLPPSISVLPPSEIALATVRNPRPLPKPLHLLFSTRSSHPGVVENQIEHYNQCGINSTKRYQTDGSSLDLQPELIKGTKNSLKSKSYNHSNHLKNFVFVYFEVPFNSTLSL